jgi:WD40 repeat protein
MIKRNDHANCAFITIAGTNDPNFRTKRQIRGSTDIRLTFASKPPACTKKSRYSVGKMLRIRNGMSLIRLIVGLMLLGGGLPGAAAAQFDPARRFHVLSTDHFLIYYHQDEDSLARRLASIAESTWTKLMQPLGVTPPPLTHVVLVDQTDVSNGSATPVPYNTIVVTAVWPAGSDFIGNVDDWLRVVFTHEFTHIVHLDRSAGWARLIRGVFGRTSLAFPNLFLPPWQIEGLATYEESVIAGGGRLHAGDFSAIVEEAARSDRLESLDRVTGVVTDWPGGLAPYAYGTGFHAYLADHYGTGSLAELAARTAGRVPYTASRAFRRIYGKSLGALWREYEDSLSLEPGTPAISDGATQLTHEGFKVSGPRFDQEPCGTCPPRIVYSAVTPHEFPSLNAVSTDGSSPHRLAKRYFGSTSAVGREVIVFDQLERRRNAGLYSDLYMFDRRSGRVHQLTSEARLQDPDLSRDGRTLACVRDDAGRRDLVLVGLKSDTARETSITTLVSAPETQFNAPRWSPDGRTIVVERHRPGARSELVVVDVATRAVRVIASDAHTRIVTPAWRPDGQAVVAAVAEEDQPFNLHEFPLDIGLAARQLTHTTGGAIWPDVAPDGQSIVFVGYTADGFDLFLMPYPVGSDHVGSGVPVGSGFSRIAPPENAALRDNSPASDASPAPAREIDPPLIPPTTVYHPWRTLKPTSWFPVVSGDSHQLRAGAATAGADVLRYHAYAASATWLVGGTVGADPPSAAVPDWQIAYAYTRWRPKLWMTASSDTTFSAGPPTDAGVPSAATRRSDQLEAGLLLPIQHVRASQTTLVSVLHASDRLTLPGQAPSLKRTGLRAAWQMMSAHTYGYSISPERGVTVGATVETVRRAFGSTADANTWTADARFYLPSAARHHVVALRLAAGASAGDSSVQRAFHLGGAIPNVSAIDFGSNAISLLRGFGIDTFAGTHVALLNAEYRWPLARPQRGAGTWPLFLHTLSAAPFADVGQTWTKRFDIANVKASAGIELSASLLAGYHFPFIATAGVARGHDGSGTVPDAWTIYLHVGRAF